MKTIVSYSFNITITMHTFVISTILIAVICIIIKYGLPRRRRPNTIAFFHLYCSSGGGGERVLWHTIEAIFKKYPHYTVYIYSHRNVQDTLRILLQVRDLFKIDLISNKRIIDRLEFIPLKLSPLIEAKRYPFLTLLLQNLFSIILAIEAAYRLVPEVYIETIGFTFTLPIFKLHKCTTMTYVHYPTISNDMIRDVEISSHPSFNNRAMFVRYPPLRFLKLMYYKMLAYLYGLAGRSADLVMVNSSWTQKHIVSLWNTQAHVVYPPCDVRSFKSLARDKPSDDPRALKIMSIAQFRPEKRHELQIEAFDMFLESTKAHTINQPPSKLTLYGGCRDQEDRNRVNTLKDLIARLDLSSSVRIVVGAPFDVLLDGMRESNVALHTMKNEHFGIVLVECMAAGLIVLAHDSGGPKTDIIDNGRDGFLADSESDFAEKLVAISKMSLVERFKMVELAKKKSELFSTKVYEDKFVELVDNYLAKKHK